MGTKHAGVLASAGTLLIARSFAYRNPFFRDTFRYTLLGVGLAPIFFLISLPQKHLLTRCWGGRFCAGWVSFPTACTLFTTRSFTTSTISTVPVSCSRREFWFATVIDAQAMRTLVELPLQRRRTRFRDNARTGSASPSDWASHLRLCFQHGKPKGHEATGRRMSRHNPALLLCDQDNPPLTTPCSPLTISTR